MNKTIREFCRKTIKEDLTTLPESMHQLFKRMYSHEDLTLPINEVVNNIPDERLDAVMQQVQRSMKNIMKTVMFEDNGLNGWIPVENGVPDKDTIYAGKYAVTVLYYDEAEAIDSGYFTPYVCSFNFTHEMFLVQCDGLNDPVFGDYNPVEITHWKPLPEPPQKILYKMSCI